MKLSDNVLNILLALVIISLILLVFIDLYINYSNFIPIKADTFVLVLGNILIALWISIIINKKQKSDELKVSNCFEELENLSNLILELRKLVSDNEFTEDSSNRIMSLINLQIDLIKKYDFIDEENIEKLKKYYKDLDANLTNQNTIDDNYKYPLLLLEKKIYVIKSQIL